MTSPWSYGRLDDDTSVQIDLFKAHHYHADRDIRNRLHGKNHSGRACISPYFPNAGVSTVSNAAQEAQQSPMKLPMSRRKICKNYLRPGASENQHVKAKEGCRKMDEDMKMLYSGGRTTLRHGSLSHRCSVLLSN